MDAKFKNASENIVNLNDAELDEATRLYPTYDLSDEMDKESAEEQAKFLGCSVDFYCKTTRNIRKEYRARKQI